MPRIAARPRLRERQPDTVPRENRSSLEPLNRLSEWGSRFRHLSVISDLSSLISDPSSLICGHAGHTPITPIEDGAVCAITQMEAMDVRGGQGGTVRFHRGSVRDFVRGFLRAPRFLSGE
jgi:hypothetical protein